MVKETNKTSVLWLIDTYITINDPDYELTIAPNGNVHIRVKWKLIVLEDGYNLFKKMGIKSPKIRFTEREKRDLKEFRIMVDMENAIENAKLGEKND
jgi:hypothetical protein